MFLLRVFLALICFLASSCALPTANTKPRSLLGRRYVNTNSPTPEDTVVSSLVARRIPRPLDRVSRFERRMITTNNNLLSHEQPIPSPASSSITTTTLAAPPSSTAVPVPSPASHVASGEKKKKKEQEHHKKTKSHLKPTEPVMHE